MEEETGVGRVCSWKTSSTCLNERPNFAARQRGKGNFGSLHLKPCPYVARGERKSRFKRTNNRGNTSVFCKAPQRGGRQPWLLAGAVPRSRLHRSVHHRRDARVPQVERQKLVNKLPRLAALKNATDSGWHFHLCAGFPTTGRKTKWGSSKRRSLLSGEASESRLLVSRGKGAFYSRPLQRKGGAFFSARWARHRCGGSFERGASRHPPGAVHPAYNTKQPLTTLGNLELVHAFSNVAGKGGVDLKGRSHRAANAAASTSLGMPFGPLR